VNTGYLDAETTDRPLEDMGNGLRSTAFGRYGAPSDPARLIGWLVSDDARWVVGQVITSDGGFRL
jgi:3-oxoacyl-[acyl-carrier protein] reductase